MTRFSTPIFVLAIVLAIFNSFAFTSTTKIMEWDEARRGVTAYEMIETGDLFTSRYRGEVDLWSAKPPLGLWFIAASYKVFGYNRFALRFPSGLAAVLTVILVGWVASQLFGATTGAFGALILATTPPFFLEHSARAGEYDAPLALLIALSMATVLFTQNRSTRSVLFGILLGLIALLKSFTVAIPVAIVALTFALSRERRVPRVREFVMISLAAASVFSCWAMPRFLQDGERFFSLMIGNDLVGRAVEAVEGHDRPWYWYLTRLFERSPIWMTVLLVGIFAAFRTKKLLSRDSYPELLTVSWASAPLLLATTLRTKLAWYINPIYPGLSILAARFVQPTRLVFSLVLLGAVASETLIVRRILKDRNLPEYERELLSSALPKGSMVEAKEWSQAAYFIARVERGYVPQRR